MAKQFEKIEKTGKADVAASIDNSDAPWRVPTEHNWEYKRLGEVCTIFNGKNQKAVENPNGPYPIYGSGGIMSYADDYICPENCTIIGRKGNINNPIFIPTKFWNVDTAFGLFPSEHLHPRFLFYFCQIYDFEKHNKATTIPSLVKKDLVKIVIPVPAREVQERIVAELDKINEVIEDCRELVRNLDDLAQSLFYNFFGDPVTNPKGWVVKKFSEVFKLSSGDGLSAKQIEPGPFPVYGGNGIVGYHATSNLGGNNIIIGRVGALCGNVRLVKGDIFVTDNAFITTFKEILNDKFAEYLLTLLDLRQYAKAAAQPVISNSSLKNIQIPLPPLQLQQEFAKRIELIEFQKKAVEETIANLKTLLDSRMDYWFN